MIVRRAAIAIAMSAAVGACATPQGVQFSTTLGMPDGLTSGDPVTHAGGRIGEVTGVRSSLYGSPTVNFEVDQNDAGLVHTDSLMVLKQAGGSRELELENPNALSPVAAAGTQLPGASSEDEANAIRMSRGLGSYAMGLAQFMSTVNSGPNPPVNSAASAAIMAQLFMLQQQAAANTYANNPAVRQQVYQLAQQLQSVQQQLAAAGRTAQAMQLQQQIQQLLNAAPPTPPNTQEIPRAIP
jgi:cell shape-determining protein MreC